MNLIMPILTSWSRRTKSRRDKSMNSRRPISPTSSKSLVFSSQRDTPILWVSLLLQCSLRYLTTCSLLLKWMLLRTKVWKINRLKRCKLNLADTNKKLIILDKSTSSLFKWTKCTLKDFPKQVILADHLLLHTQRVRDSHSTSPKLRWVN
jgi:hypothetical protein